MDKTFKLSFNLLMGTISEQLTQQGWKFNADEMEELEDCRTAIFSLSVHSMINEKVEAKLKEKLFKKVRSHIMKNNKMKLLKPIV